MISYLLIGIVAGFLAGLLGIGGGLITVPALFFLIGDMHLAIGTSLAAMILTTLTSSIAHQRKKGIDWRIALLMGPGIIIGAILGPLIASHIQSNTLTKIFAIFEIGVGAYLALGASIYSQRKLPSSFLLTLSAALISTLSGMLGIGGGLFTVPFLHFFNTPMKQAIGTSAFFSFLIMTVASTSFFILGGHLDLRAFAAIAIAACFCAPLGTHLSHKLRASILKRIFGGVLILTGVMLI